MPKVTTCKLSWLLNLKPAQGYLPDALTTVPTCLTHSQTDIIKTPTTIKWMQKCIGFDTKSKLPANTDSVLYTENLLEVIYGGKKGMLFLVCQWPRLNSPLGRLTSSVNTSFESWVRSPRDFHAASLESHVDLLPVLQGSLLKWETCVTADLCFVILAQTVWLCQHAGELHSASLGSTGLCILLTCSKYFRI